MPRSSALFLIVVFTGLGLSATPGRSENLAASPSELIAPAKTGGTLSLAGQWRFRIDEREVGIDEQWSQNVLAGDEHIKLPGTMDDSGLGPKNHKPPTLEGPYRRYDYAGAAWYQREIEIPADWQGKRIALFLERCRWVTSAWLDDHFLGSRDSLIAPHQYDFGAGVSPGKHRLTLCVDNRVRLNLGRFVSALFGGTWGNMNGIIGRIELSATPLVWIKTVQVYPDAEHARARVVVEIGNASAQPGRAALTIAGPHPAVTEANWNEHGGRAEIDVDLCGTARWDEFAPNLTKLVVKLGEDSRTVQFGLRDFRAKGTQFTLNDRPIFLRGTLECSTFPLTGYPPTDNESWRRIYRIIRSYGLNHMRFHSWCPPEAAFAAADEEGIILQVEGPQANVPIGSDAARDRFLEAELTRIVDTYGNHPSFCLMALGNEFGGKDEMVNRWLRTLIERDSRHLYSCASNSRQKPEVREFTVSPAGRGILGPATDRDLAQVVAGDIRPILGHEIGQWPYYPDFRESAKYRGVMTAANLEMIRDDLEAKGQLDLAPQYAEASGRLATLLYKEEIEVLLRTRGYAGFALLGLHDYPTQGTALIGPLNAFWESKGFITPEAYRHFCGPTVPLLRMAKRTFVADEPFVATADVAHFGAADLDHIRPVWRIADANGREIAAGAWEVQNFATGKLTSLGAMKASLAQAPAPGKLKVTVTLAGTGISNDWEIWVYPAHARTSVPDGIVVCEDWKIARDALSAGKKVVLFAGRANTIRSLSGRFLPLFWNPVWVPDQRPNTMGLLCDPHHPLFAEFPTEMHSNWQWFELLQHSRSFMLDEAPTAYRPLLQVIDNFARNEKLGLIFECRVGEGHLLVCGIDLPALPEDPAARQLLSSLYAYAGSAAFSPSQAIAPEILERLFVPRSLNHLQALGAKLHANVATDGNPLEFANDGRMDTSWRLRLDKPTPAGPHSLIIELAEPMAVAGITCIQAQHSWRTAWLAGGEVRISADGRDWSEPIARGVLRESEERQEIRFAQQVTTRFLRFDAIGVLDPDAPYAALTEFDLIPAK